MNKIYSFFGGRHTFFGLTFMVNGIILTYMHVLSGDQFLVLIGTIQSFIFAHSAKEDYFSQKKPQ